MEIILAVLAVGLAIAVGLEILFYWSYHRI